MFVVSRNRCAFELEAPAMVTRTKRGFSSGRLAKDIPRDLRGAAWDPSAVEFRFADLAAAADYEIEVTYVTEEDVHRTQSLWAGSFALHPPTALLPGRPLTLRVPVPPEAVRSGALEVEVRGEAGPVVVVTELVLYSSVPAPLVVVVLGDSAGGVLGSVSDAAQEPRPGAIVEVSSAAGSVETVTDALGMFRIPNVPGLGLPGLGLAVPSTVTVTATQGDEHGTAVVPSTHLSLGLREVGTEADRVSLAGEWELATAGSPSAATVVPGHIVFDGLVAAEGVGTLTRDFEIPVDWRDDAIFLRFDGAYGRAEVRVNGHLAGVHSSGVNSFDLDVAPFLIDGTNTVSVELTEVTPHAFLDYMNWYAHMSLFGIWREVYLFRVARVHLGALAVTSDWADGVGDLEVPLTIISQAQEQHDYRVVVDLLRAGFPVATATAAGTTTPGGAVVDRVSFTLEGAEPWSAEVPVLYGLRVTLHAGNAVQEYVRTVGFRRVEVVGNELRVNGSAIRILGVNRHDARMTRGRALSEDDLRSDILNFRRANFNTIRTSHYPPDPRLVQLCDELGMYLFLEPPIIWAGGLAPTRFDEAPQLIPHLFEVAAETVARDRSHCSVIVWDIANESEWTPQFAALNRFVNEMDPSRPTIFSFDLNELHGPNPILAALEPDRPSLRSYHYPGIEQPWEKDLERFATLDRPVICDEYMPIFEACQRFPHEAYALPIDPGLRDYWVTAFKPFMESLLATRNCIGGMVWSGVDDLFAIPIDESIGSGGWSYLPAHYHHQPLDLFTDGSAPFFRGDGEWGVLDAWGRPRAESWHLQKMYSPISISDAVFDSAGGRLEFVVRNDHSHRSLGSLSVVAAVDGCEHAVAVSAAPGEEKRVALAFAPGAGKVELTFEHPENWIVDGYTWTSATYGSALAERLRTAGAPVVIGDDGTLRPRLSSGPEELAWPVLHVQGADRPDLVTQPMSITGVEPRDGGGVVSMGNDEWTGTVAAMAHDGSVTFHYDFTFLGDEAFTAREVGLRIDAPDSFSNLWWRREGDWTYYPESHIGRREGYAAASPRAADRLKPTPTWELDGTPAGTNDFRSAKRNVELAGLTDGVDTISVHSGGTQSVRAELRDGRPVLHVLDWYGGVRTLDPAHPVWSDYFGGGQAIEPGARIEGSVTITFGGLPESVRT